MIPSKEADLDEDPQRAVTRLLDATCRIGGVPEEFESLAQTIGSSAVDSRSPERLKAWWLYRVSQEWLVKSNVLKLVQTGIV